jgi:hypothetical protein
MYKTLTLTLTLLLLISVASLQAQDAGKTSSPTTIQGCLQYSKSHYRLTDSAGKSYQLSSQANKLTHHVGQQVEITGKPGVRTLSTTETGTASSTKEESVFFVKTVKQLADTCQAAGN